MKKLLNIIAVGLLLVPFALSSDDTRRLGSNLRFVAHEGARNSVEQNKRFIAPYILSTRDSKTLGTIGNTMVSDWAEGDVVFEDVSDYTDVGRQWSANVFKNSDLAQRPGSYSWKNCLVTPSVSPYNAGMKWGLRGYNVPHCEFIDCDFFAIPQEHGLYISNYEGSVVDNCTFIRVGSQGVQFAHRSSPYQQYSADNRPYKKKPIHILRDSHFIDCAQDGTRPGYNASYFNPGSSEFPGTLLIEDCSFVCKWIRPVGYFQSLSTGALAVTPMQGNEPLTDNFMELVYVKNCLFDFTRGNRGIVNIRSTDTVIFEDCCFIARDHSQPNLNIDSYTQHMGTSKTQRIILRNCVGVGGVKIRVFQRTPNSSQVVSHDVNTYGREVIINGETGQVISSGAYN